MGGFSLEKSRVGADSCCLSTDQYVLDGAVGEDPPMKTKEKEAEIDRLRLCSYNVTTNKGGIMAADAIVRARVSEEVKIEAAAIFEAAGLTTSDAIRMMLVRAVEDGALPFDPVKPNAKTIRAIKAARAGKVKKAKSSKQLLAKLNARD